MNNLAIAAPALSLAEYQNLERETDIRHEYYDGKIIAMAGGTGRHSIICSNINFEIELGLKNKSSKCRCLNSEMKVSIEQANTYVYPDAMVVCGKLQWGGIDPHAITNPTLIVEVLSASSLRRDRVTKFNLYKTIFSFREYALIDQTEPQVEVYFKRSLRHLWQKTVYDNLADVVKLQSLGIEIPMPDLYRDVL